MNNMNWLLIGAGVICLICVIVGYVRGFIKIAVSLAATIATLVLVFIVTPYVSKGICSFTPVDDMIQKKCIEALKIEASSVSLSKEDLAKAGVTDKMLEVAGITEDKLTSGKLTIDEIKQYGAISDALRKAGITNEDIEEEITTIEIPRQKQVEAIKKADIPPVFKELLLSNNNNEVYKRLDVSSFPEYIGAYIAKMVIGIISFLVTFVIIFIIVRSIIFALDIVADLPVLSGINRLAGAGIGLVTALIIIWLAFLVVTLLYTTGIGGECFELIGKSKMLTFLYNNNYILKLSTSFR